MDIILASGSPRRKELLHYIFEEFKIVPSQANETYPENTPAEEVPVLLASAKAADVHRQYPEALVIGCDTVVIADGQILGKPKDGKDAFSMLQILSGKKHSVVTGCCVFAQNKSVTFSQSTEVEFYPLTEKEITDYIKTGEPFDKAGAYGIQGYGSLLVKTISGDYFNVVGLPTARLKREIAKLSADNNLSPLL